MSYLGKLSPTVGNGLGGMPEGKVNISFNSVVKSASIQFSQAADTTVDYIIPFNPASFPALDIVWKDTQPLGGSGFGSSTGILIPNEIGGGSIQYWANVSTGTNITISYISSTNAIRVTTTGTSYIGCFQVLERLRTLKTRVVLPVATTESPIGLTIASPSKAWIAISSMNGVPCFVNSYLPSNGGQAWHVTSYTGTDTRQLGIMSPTTYITSASAPSCSLMIFE